MSLAAETIPSEATILSRVIRPDRGTWSRDAAESILRLDFPPTDIERMNALAAKELLQSKARLSLQRPEN